MTFQTLALSSQNHDMLSAPQKSDFFIDNLFLMQTISNAKFSNLIPDNKNFV